MNSKVISISAISAGLVALFLTLGAYFELVDLFTIILASIFVILPLYYNSYKGSVLSFLAGGLIAFMFSGFNLMSLVFPAYFAFFGIYPIIKCKMQDKNFNKVWGLIIGLVWFIIVAFGLYFYYTLFMGVALEGLPNWLIDYILIFVFLIAVIFFFIFDRFILIIRKVADYYLNKIIK